MTAERDKRISVARRVAVRAALAGLAVAALIVVAIAPKPSAPSDPAPVSDRAPATEIHPTVMAARRFALAANEWEGAGYGDAYVRRLALACRDYRRQLARARPSPTQLEMREADGAASSAALLGADLAVAGRGRVRVLVAMREQLVAARDVSEQLSLNEVRLVRDHRRWCVDGWTLVPTGGGVPG